MILKKLEDLIDPLDNRGKTISEDDWYSQEPQLIKYYNTLEVVQYETN